MRPQRCSRPVLTNEGLGTCVSLSVEGLKILGVSTGEGKQGKEVRRASSLLFQKHWWTTYLLTYLLPPQVNNPKKLRNFETQFIVMHFLHAAVLSSVLLQTKEKRVASPSFGEQKKSTSSKMQRKYMTRNTSRSARLFSGVTSGGSGKQVSSPYFSLQKG